MTCVGKPLTSIRYEDLLISSKFFYKEGSENSSESFPDDIKEGRSETTECHQEMTRMRNNGHFECAQDEKPQSECNHTSRLHGDPGALYTHQSSDSKKTTEPAALDIDVAMEAACGDPSFLVSDKQVLSVDRKLIMYCLQVELVDSVCSSARDNLCKMQGISSAQVGNDTLLKLLLKLNNCACIVGFLSLASATAAYHDAIIQGDQTDPVVIKRCLEAELRRAQTEWERVRTTHIYIETTTGAQDTKEEAKAYKKAEIGTKEQPAASFLRALVVRQHLENRH